VAPSGRREPFTIRFGRHPAARSFFLGLATLAAALGFPIKVAPPPQRRTPVTVVREGDPAEPEPKTPRPVR